MYNICTMLDQRRRRWADVVQMLDKCFVFAGLGLFSDIECSEKHKQVSPSLFFVVQDKISDARTVVL